MIKREEREVAIIAVFSRMGLRCRANSNDRNKSGSPFSHYTLQLMHLYPGIETRTYSIYVTRTVFIYCTHVAWALLDYM
jgi:hypothetical protein